MTRILVGLLVIMLVNGQSNGFCFSDIKTIIRLADAIYTKATQYIGDIQSFTQTDSEKMDQALKKINEISSELRSLSMKIDLKLDKMMKTLLINLQESTALQLLRKELNDHLNIVKGYYNDSVEYGTDNKTYTINTLETFAHLILSTSKNLPGTLRSIHQLFTNLTPVGYLQLLLRNTRNNLPFDCNRDVSAQQELYYTYISVLMAEMQGLHVSNQVYLIKQTFEEDHNNYTNELILTKNRYKSRLTDYNNIMFKYLSEFSREIRHCDVNPPKRDINYIELEGVARAKLWHESTLYFFTATSTLHQDIFPCGTACYKITRDGPIMIGGDQVTNCQYLGGTVKVCSAPQGSPRAYLWWKNDWATYGHDEVCDNEKDMSGDPLDSRGNCEMCVCSAFRGWESSGIRKYINLAPQLSDVENNMVVTGVQFAMKDNKLSLLMQENKFLPGGMSNNTGSWKTVNYGNADDGGYSFLINYERKTIYLDDIMVPDRYVVTGVRFSFNEDPAGFQLQVHATRFNLDTGELDRSSGEWIDAGDYDAPGLRGYERSRAKIDMGDHTDSPIRGSTFNYDPETNKYIEIRHTSLYEDAGQTTIPLIEAVGVESMSPFPLSGVGVSFKGREGYGGYIAPRIYTMDISKYFENV